MESLKVGIVFLLMIILLRKRYNLGLVMFISALLLGFLFKVPVIKMIEIIGITAVYKGTIQVIGALILISGLEYVLRNTGLLKQMVESLKKILGDKRLVMASLPAIIGFLPSPGGARFSAPIVGEVSGAEEYTAENKTFINYWFRHIWEYSLPLYPAIIFSAEFLQVHYSQVALHTIPFTLIAAAIGGLFAFRHTKNSSEKFIRDISKRELWKNFIVGIGPIFTVLFLVLVLKINILFSLFAVLLFLIIWKKFRGDNLINLIKSSFSFNLIFLVFGSLYFKNILEISGGMDSILKLINSLGIPAIIVVSIVPFLIGILTGLSTPMITISFPMILALLVTGTGINWSLFVIAYVSGFAGVMLSPLHLCFLLTLDHFKADFNEAYKKLWVPEGLLVIFSFVFYYIYKII